MNSDYEGSVHALSGAYAVDALDDVERAGFETHLAQCADCRDEVDGLREAAGLLAELEPVAPPPELRDRLLADIRRVRPLPPIRQKRNSPAGRSRLFRRAMRLPLLAAAAVVLAVVGVGVLVQPWQHSPGSGQISAVDQVLQATDAQRVTQELSDGARATLVRSVSKGRAVLLTKDMPPAPSGHVYELWLQTPTSPMEPAGLMTKGGNQTVLLKGDAAKATAAGITIEPAGGSPRPTTEPIALFDMGKAS